MCPDREPGEPIVCDLGRSISSQTLRRTALRLLGAFALLACWQAPLHAQSAEEIAKRIVTGGDAFRWAGAQSRVRMVLIEGDGKKKERTMEVIGRQKDGKYQSLVRF